MDARGSLERAANEDTPMTPQIRVSEVVAVLLPDGWHTVDWAGGRSSFSAGSFELIDVVEGASTTTSPIDDQNRAGCRPGFAFRERDHEVCGPMRSILAVKVSRTNGGR